ncbi:MAG: pyridoxamine 5'-phosphate oxidase family protein [Thermosynechococcaceae cyanobacterium MS004]|nr:pyridoxamine 5'-phosphate oxidase family protein [Thermosynechococcaceae cyanobacterium MS004]
MTPLASWRPALARALHLNRALANARYFQLATVRADGRPANRTVVFRGFRLDTNQLMIISDRRAQKIAQLQQSPWAEICWYFPKTREQFRLSGRLSRIDQGNAELQHSDYCDFCQVWEKLSASAREQFYWPPPGQPHHESESPLAPPTDQEQPAENFTLLLFDPIEVDHLDLRSHPHVRHRYGCEAGQWSVEKLNP